MKISRGSVRVFVVMAAALFLLTVGPAAVMAGGEPGTGCDDPDLRYDPAPYIGDVTVTWNDNGDGTGDVYLSITTPLVQMGNTGCSGNFSGLLVEDIPDTEFASWKPNDLRLYCIQNEDAEGGKKFSCADAYLTVVGVGGMKRVGHNSFTAKLIIMALQ